MLDKQQVSFLHTDVGGLQGIARDLIDTALLWAQSRGVTHMYVHVIEGNEAAQQLYDTCGFDVEGRERADAAARRQQGRRFLLCKAL